MVDNQGILQDHVIHCLLLHSCRRYICVVSIGVVGTVAVVVACCQSLVAFGVLLGDYVVISPLVAVQRCTTKHQPFNSSIKRFDSIY